MSGWPRPSWDEVARLFREGFGAWLGAWGWRLSAATDAIVLASLGNPVAITMLAMTAKLGPDAHADVLGAGRQQPRRPRAVVGRAASRPHARGRRRGLPRLSGPGDRRDVRRARGQRRVRARLGRRASVRRLARQRDPGHAHRRRDRHARRLHDRVGPGKADARRRRHAGRGGRAGRPRASAQPAVRRDWRAARGALRPRAASSFPC